MKELINFCPVHGYDGEIRLYPGGIEGYLKDNELDGIELYVYGTEHPDTVYAGSSVGVHLKYWPCWMDFWLGDEHELERNHKSRQARREYFNGASTREQWLDVIRMNIRAALAMQPEYLVWHVSHAGMEEVFSYDFKYTDTQVIKATIEVVKEIKGCIPQNVKILFENLWWPGLKLTNPSVVEKLFDGLAMDNAGIMLDTGHLMNANISLRNESEGVNYIKRVIGALGSFRELIRGVHLNCSLSGAYQSRCGKPMEKSSELKKIMEHIMKIDQHKIFRNTVLSGLLAQLGPEYLVHELYYDSFTELSEYLKIQRSLM